MFIMVECWSGYIVDAIFDVGVACMQNDVHDGVRKY